MLFFTYKKWLKMQFNVSKYVCLDYQVTLANKSIIRGFLSFFQVLFMLRTLPLTCYFFFLSVFFFVFFVFCILAQPKSVYI